MVDVNVLNKTVAAFFDEYGFCGEQFGIEQPTYTKVGVECICNKNIDVIETVGDIAKYAIEFRNFDDWYAFNSTCGYFDECDEEEKQYLLNAYNECKCNEFISCFDKTLNVDFDQFDNFSIVKLVNGGIVQIDCGDSDIAIGLGKMIEDEVLDCEDVKIDYSEMINEKYNELICEKYNSI